MDIRGLRVGSLVHCTIFNRVEIYRIAIIDAVDNTLFLDGVRHRGYVLINKIEPIPLTEDLLLKCGFKYISEEQGFHNFYRIAICDMFGHEFNLDLTNRHENEIQSQFEFYNWDIHFSVGTLHQLQNLYFAITGRELDIKL